MAVNTALANMSRISNLPLLQWSENLIRCRHPAPAKPDLAIRPDQVNGPLHEQSVGVIELRYFLSFVHQQRERQFLFLSKARVTVRALRVNAEHRHSGRPQPVPIIAQLAK